MNPETTSAVARWQRIKIVSRIARWTVLGFLIFTGWMLLRMLPYSSFNHSADQEASWQQIGFSLTTFVYHVVLCVWYWKLAQLFRLYERGMIFAAATIRCIKNLGCLCMVGWIFMASSHFLYQPKPHLPPTPPPGAVLLNMTTHTFRMGFFSFDFGTGIDFGILLGGLVVVLAAWIMDEGRKIQEEQELTV